MSTMSPMSPMKSTVPMIRLIFLFLAAPLTSAIACENGVALISENAGAPKAYVEMDRPPTATPFSIKIHFCGDDVIEDLSVSAVMPMHQHGMNYTPRVTKVRDASFRVDNMVFHMPGMWEILVEANQGATTFLYTHSVNQK